MNDPAIRRAIAILDPRGVAAVAPAPLAPRPARTPLGRLLLFDNGKLTSDIGSFGAILPALKAALHERGVGSSLEEVRQELMLLDRPATIALARALADRRFDGVVVAFGDAGVTTGTVMLAAELERAGVPTVTLCQQAAYELASASAAHLAPGLPLVTVTTSRTGSPEEVARATRSVIDAIVAGLTTDVRPRSGRGEESDPAGGGGLVARDGMLVLDGNTESRHADPAVDHEPGWFGEALYERLTDGFMTDGLPIIPPTRDRVDRMLGCTDRLGALVLVDSLPPSGAALTVEKLAVAAVMAGCRPEHFPLLVAALEAMSDESYRLYQAVITGHPGGNAVVFSGPLAREAGLASGGGCLGPGFRANATIGRAITLALLNTSRALPGRSDLAVFGSPAEFSYCFAEALDRTPWAPIHVDLFDAHTTTVTVHRCEAPHNVVDYLSSTPESVLETIAGVAATVGGNNAYVPSDLLVILSPEHARIIAGAGWSKRDVQAFLFDQARIPAYRLIGRGVPPIPPRSPRPDERVPVASTASDILIVVAGGEGPHSMVGIPWGFARAISRPVAFADGRPIRSLAELTAALGTS